MTPGDDGAGRPSGLSRRRLLAGIGGVGAVGMASGLGTGAHLADRETFADNVFGAGSVELIVNEAVTDGTFAVDVSDIDRGHGGTETFDIEVRTNPARVWLATDCPSAGDALADAIEVDVVVDRESVTDGYRPLAEVERELVAGERIDAGCLGPDDRVTVEVNWRLPGDAPDEVAGEATDLTFRLYAEQCRHVAEADAAASNPFADRVCEGSDDDCPACVEFGKADDVEAALAVGDVLPLTELPAGVGAHDIEITAVETKDDGEAVGAAFALRGPDGAPGPAVCAVEIKGGPGTERYEIDPAAPETGEVLFAPRKPDSDERHGISHIVVSVCSGDDGDGGDDSSDCVVCDDEAVSLASLDVRYRGDDDASVTAVSTGGNTGGTLFEGTLAPGGAFTLFGSDVIRGGNAGNGNAGTDKLGPEVEIAVDGGVPISLHVSCSELLAVGMRFGDGDLFEVAGGTTTDGESLCDSEAI